MSKSVKEVIILHVVHERFPYRVAPHPGLLIKYTCRENVAGQDKFVHMLLRSDLVKQVEVDIVKTEE